LPFYSVLFEDPAMFTVSALNPIQRRDRKLTNDAERADGMHGLTNS